ncbi:secretion system protein [Legionella cardiaca]|uniref:Secretion system protein n=1 Tax=Legionella cardiaca TaxID=1071983 RepID=A0ABY8ASK2_9GAMM|nr:secretion system protein [Legionella cardiaca]WED42291.1 secretion system protein [Legionella cardiaca]
MPNTALKSFLDRIKKTDESHTEVKLVLKTSKQIKSFLAALKDSANIGVQSITELDLSRSELNQEQIIELVAVLNTLPTIHTLRLDHSKITDDFTTELAKLTHVRTLSLKNNSLNRRPAFNANLEALYLDNNTQISSRQVLFTLGLKAASLKKLSLKNCGVTDDALHYLKDSKLKNLTYLNLYKNNITSQGMESVATLQNLETLNISLNAGVGDDGVKAIQDLDKLRTLRADSCGIGVTGLAHLSQMKLHTVDLGYNPGLKQPWDFANLKPNDTIHTLKLNFCSLNDKHATALRAQFKALTHFNGANNNMTKVGVLELLANQALVTLDVSTQQLYRKPVVTSGNKSFFSTQKVKVETLRKKVVIESKEQIEPLLIAIRKAPALTAIHLEHTGLTDKMLLSLIPERTERLRKLKKLNGEFCKIQKKKLEEQIARKKEEKRLAQIEIIEVSSQVPTQSLVELGPDPDSIPNVATLTALLADKDQLIGKLQKEIERLQGELAKVTQHSESLEKPKHKSSNRDRRQVIIPAIFQQQPKSSDTKSKGKEEKASEATSSNQPN